MRQGESIVMAVVLVLICNQNYVVGFDIRDILFSLVESVVNVFRLEAVLFRRYESPSNDMLTVNYTVDFIIIGAGAAGSVLANRLSEVSEWNILILEAGEQPSLLTDVPFLCGAFVFSTYNWGYQSEVQDSFCRGCSNKRALLPQGKCLGGGSVLNYMVYARGNPLDYDQWKSSGNDGWSYKDVLPYFIKSEDSHIAKADMEYHGEGGYLTTSDVPFRTKSLDAFVDAAQEAGYPYVDSNGESQYGVSYLQATLRNGRRCSAEKSFLRTARKRPNLNILTGSEVVKILIDSENKAYGVEYIRKGKKHTALARKEIIVSGGAINSPKLLMLSGIGPEEHLKELGIPVIKNLPVGKKLFDHIAFTGVIFEVNQNDVITLEEVLKPANLFNYAVKGTSVFTSPIGIESLLFMRTNVSDNPNPNHLDMEIMYISAGFDVDLGIIYKKVFNIPDETYNTLWKPLENKYIYQIIPVLLHPKSHGYVKLISKNYSDEPRIFSNHLSDPGNDDVKTFIAAITEIQRISQSPALQKLGSKLVTTPINGCENYTFNTDDYWECGIRTLITSLSHPIATCRMGPANDTEAVVSDKLEVYGIGNLRVVDSSVVPFTVTGHMVAPVYVIGEKASDIIKNKYRNG